MAKKKERKRYRRYSRRTTPLPYCDAKVNKNKCYRAPLESIPENPISSLYYVSFTCITPVVLPATVKAGSRSGENRQRIPLVVDDNAVFFIKPDVYDVYYVPQTPVHVYSDFMIMFFTTRVRNKHDLASHMG